jgi:hypothetical protein
MTFSERLTIHHYKKILLQHLLMLQLEGLFGVPHKTFEVHKINTKSIKLPEASVWKPLVGVTTK